VTYVPYLGVTYILNLIIAFFINVLPIEIVLRFFIVDAMTTTDDMTTRHKPSDGK
jgi:hypothetical protein